ncbi:class II fructose-bisphosphate aldolase [Propionispira raffinosivorans]|uniref:class II fructose-bisphosphate aldolase n=1 Tax=Propionispira raffinosivorans TaxID=86959 RepID=UPI00037691D0|nr:class II fructose-bisphosphate aldolase [Propionispira raffinosivorans]
MYKTLTEVLEQAEKFNFTVGSFNMHNMEMLPAMIMAAKEMGSPIIIQTSAGTAKYIGYGVIASVCKYMADYEDVDVVLHLDHAAKFDDIRTAIEAGYSSVMFDGSALPFKENILRTRAVVEYAHKRGVSVEAELGTIGGTEEGVHVSAENMVYTDPKAAKIFVEATGIDALAVGVGTNHGQYKSKTELNFPLLKEINETIDTPLVIHGGTGVKEEDIHQCTNYGVRKFNVGTELLVGWTEAAQKMFGQTKVNASLRNNIVPCNDVVKDVIKRKIGIFLNL